MEYETRTLTHYLAATRYRFEGAVRGAPAEYPALAIGSGVRSPLETLSHMNDVLWFTRKKLTEARDATDVGPSSARLF